MHSRKQPRSERKRPAPNGTFPLLSPEQIIDGLHSLNIDFPAEQLTQPTYHDVRVVFESIMQMAMGLPRSLYTTLHIDGIDKVSFPRLHDDSAPLLVFFRQLSRLMNAVGIHDFCLRHLMKPEVEALKRQLSGIINFLRYREDCTRRHEGKLQVADAIIQKRGMLVDDIASLRESVSLGQEKKEMMAMEVDKARKVKEELDSNLWALNTTKLEITDEANALKEEKNHLVANHHQLEEDRHQVTILREAIRAKIVQNPEGLLEANRQTTAQIEDLNNHINESESRASDQRERKEATQRLEEAFRLRNGVVMACLDLQERAADLSIEIRNAQQMIEERRAATTDVKALIGPLERQLTDEEARLVAVNDTYAQNHEKGLKRLDMEERDFTAFEKAQAEKTQEITEKMDRIDAMRAEMAAAKKEVNDQVEDYRELCSILRSSYSRYMSDMSTAHALPAWPFDSGK